MSNPKFNPVWFLYLYPELYPHISNSVEKASAYYTASNDPMSPFKVSIDLLPDTFDYNVFISDNKSLVNASALNLLIKETMLGDDMSEKQIEVNSKFITNIYFIYFSKFIFCFCLCLHNNFNLSFRIEG